MYPNLINHIQTYVQLSEQDIQTLYRHIKFLSLNRREVLLREGQICRSYYFVEKGCLRMYFLNNKGMEKTTQFALEHWWLSDYFSLLDQKPSEYTIETIEQSEILAISAQSFEDLLKEVPVLELYFRKVMQKAVAASQLRIKLLYELSKEELFLLFNAQFPEFVQRVPQYMLASYLGLTPEYLSEIRKKK